MLGKRAKILSDANIRDLLAFTTRTRHPLRNRVIDWPPRWRHRQPDLVDGHRCNWRDWDCHCFRRLGRKLYGWSDNPVADLQEGVDAALNAVQLDERNPYTTSAASLEPAKPARPRRRGLRRQHYTANHLARAQVLHYDVHIVERSGRDRHLRWPGAAYEVH
jgi:hypothetical protein